MNKRTIKTIVLTAAFLLLAISIFYNFQQQNELKKNIDKQFEMSKTNFILQIKNDSLFDLIKTNNLNHEKTIDSICKLDNYQLKQFILSKLK